MSHIPPSLSFKTKMMSRVSVAPRTAEVPGKAPNWELVRVAGPGLKNAYTAIERAFAYFAALSRESTDKLRAAEILCD
jgi:hypothetical protein